MGSGVLAVTGVYLLVLARSLKIPHLRLLGAFAPAATGVAMLTGALLAARPAIAHLPQLAQLGLLIGLGAAVYGAVILALARRRLLADVRAFSVAHAKGPGAAPVPAAPV